MNVRQMLLDLGVPSITADVAIPFVWFIPGSVDPDSAAIIELNRAMQRGLRRLGYKRVQVTGVLDRETAMALDQVSPPRGSWMRKTFVQILGDILNASPADTGPAYGLAGYFEYAGEAPGPLPSWRAGTPPGPLGSTWTDLMTGISSSSSSAPAPRPSGLSFGRGVRNKDSIIPIPKSSGKTYNAFTNLQRQINRLLSKVGGRISEDGIIGKRETYPGLQKAQRVIGISVPGDEDTLSMAENAVQIASILKSEADAMGIPANANRGTSVSRASASEPTPPPMTRDQEKQLRGGGIGGAIKTYLPFLAIAGGVAWYAASKRKRKRK